MDNLGAIILAAGKGSRMKLGDKNKVTLSLGGTPMILRTIQTLSSLSIFPLVVVVGHAKESVKEVLRESTVMYAQQDEQLGSGHAVQTGFAVLPKTVLNVLVVNGDDSAFYTKELLTEVITTHTANKNALTFLTTLVQNPGSIGRIIRDTHGGIIKIVEEKDASGAELQGREINVGCYVFSVDFLQKYLHTIEKSPKTGEYYITELVAIALSKGEKVEALKKENLIWRGVNTPQELEEAELLLQ